MVDRARLTIGVLFFVCLCALLAVAWGWGWSSACGWMLAGAVTGLLSSRYARLWVAWLAALAYAPLVVLLGLARLSGGWWLLGQVVLVAIVSGGVTLGYVAGVAVAQRRRMWSRLSGEWHELGRASRVAMAGVVLGGVVLLASYVVFVGVMGSELWLSSGDERDCRTPGFAYGWTYEAVNYDAADDQQLRPTQGADGRWTCVTQGSTAGDAVMTTDGVAIAGWYIPSKIGSGERGPTLIVVPGGKSNKSGMLMYLPAVHDSYNLLVLDNRGMGRSGPGGFTFGLNESRDVSAMLDWLEREKGPTWIGALGNSMGAAAVLAAAADDQRIRALVLDSMHASVVFAAGRVLETEFGVPAQPGAWALINASSLKLGSDVAAMDPINTIVRLGARPVLLIHGTADVIDVPDHSAELNLHAALAAGVPAQLVYCRGGTHGALVNDRDCAGDWERWARSFLADAAAR